ncbi:MAG: cytidylate kinase family protein [Candidatus Roizmanbacteria bacterium]
MEFKYDNIAISGGVAVGKNTLYHNLQTYLSPNGWKFRTTGQIIREYTKNNILPLATLVSKEFDAEIEARTKYLLEKEKQWVIEAWLAGFIARDLNNTLRILLTCSNDAIRIDRVSNRDKVTVADAKHFIKLREEENFKKWRSQYGEYDFFNPKYFHIVVDTYQSGPHETVGKILDAIGFVK